MPPIYRSYSAFKAHIHQVYETETRVIRYHNMYKILVTDYPERVDAIERVKRDHYNAFGTLFLSILITPQRKKFRLIILPCV